jgi:hypothetical protein
MKNWFTSLNGAITLSAIAWLTELWRAFLDMFRIYPFELGYSDFVKNTGAVFLVTLLYTALFAGWAWAMLQGLRGSRRALISALILNLLFLLAIPIGTLVAYCPSPCSTVWPLMELANWLNLIAGLLAAVSLGSVLWFSPRSSSPFPAG